MLKTLKKPSVSSRHSISFGSNVAYLTLIITLILPPQGHSKLLEGRIFLSVSTWDRPMLATKYLVSSIVKVVSISWSQNGTEHSTKGILWLKAVSFWLLNTPGLSYHLMLLKWSYVG